MPYLQVRDPGGEWRTVIEDMGMPAGKPKTIVVDLTEKLLSDSREVRIVTNLCVYWDEIFLSEETGPPEVRLSDLHASTAELRFRGFSHVEIHPERKQPERFVYARRRSQAMWNPTPGLYTRFGHVEPLLEEVDDRLVVMGSGDELRLVFDGAALPALPAGWKRDFLLLVDGWAKDGDANTAHSQTVEALPYHGMPQYPYESPHHFPDDGSPQPLPRALQHAAGPADHPSADRRDVIASDPAPSRAHAARPGDHRRGKRSISCSAAAAEEAPETGIEPAAPEEVEPLATPLARFTDVTAEAGIDFVHVNGAYGDKLLPETMGGGVAFFDYDGDDHQDLLFVNSSQWPHHVYAEAPPSMALYRNDGTGRFRDVTREAGLEVSFYGMGVAVADYDADGDSDVFFTAVGPNHLFRNDGGRFVDVTSEAGVAGGAREWSTAAGYFDYDGDGDLDLFVGNYLQWSKEIDFEIDFRLTGIGRAFGPPQSYLGHLPLSLPQRRRRERSPRCRPRPVFASTIPPLGCPWPNPSPSASSTSRATATWTFWSPTTRCATSSSSTRATAPSSRWERTWAWPTTATATPPARWVSTRPSIATTATWPS